MMSAEEQIATLRAENARLRYWLDLAAKWMDAEARSYEKRARGIADSLQGAALGQRAGRDELLRVLAEDEAG